MQKTDCFCLIFSIYRQSEIRRAVRSRLAIEKDVSGRRNERNGIICKHIYTRTPWREKGRMICKRRNVVINHPAHDRERNETRVFTPPQPGEQADYLPWVEQGHTEHSETGLRSSAQGSSNTIVISDWIACATSMDGLGGGRPMLAGCRRLRCPSPPGLLAALHCHAFNAPRDATKSERACSKRRTREAYIHA